jgi:hypothetical protein
MANEIRVRRNNIAGTITNNPLTSGGTSITSANFVDLPTIDTTSHLLLILDPLEVVGAAEIVRVTAHSAASSTVTVVRGAENTTPREHALNTTWYHGPVVSDWSDILTSATRPAVPYEGQLIYETDTNKFFGFGGVDWASRDAGGQLGYAQAVTNQSVSTAAVDLTSLTTTVTVGTGRRVKVSCTLPSLQVNTANDRFQVNILEDGVSIQASLIRHASAGTVEAGISFAVVKTPTAGMHTYKLQGITIGTGPTSVQMAATQPGFILVEDIGAA